MYVACSSLCFGRYPLVQALHAISEMNFHKVDLALHEDGPHIKPSEVLADVNRIAVQLRKANVSYAAFHCQMGPIAADLYRDTLRAVCRLSRLLAVPVVNIPAAPAGSALDQEVARLTPLLRVAESEGVILTVETHSATLTAEVPATAELCRLVPGLGLTLDPSHYMVGPLGEQDYEPLYPFVRHVRLRDTSADKLQVRIGQGRLEYGKIITGLAREDYNRALTVDIHDNLDQAMPTDQEVRKLKYLLESMV